MTVSDFIKFCGVAVSFVFLGFSVDNRKRRNKYAKKRLLTCESEISQPNKQCQ